MRRESNLDVHPMVAIKAAMSRSTGCDNRYFASG
jgi:hypothetical protein